jgi:putative tricarboxylic transport membrane protein
MLGIAAPLGAAAAAVVVATWYIAPGVDLDAMTRGVAGPGAWPRVMLYGAAVCAILIFARNLWAAAVRGGSPRPQAPSAAGEEGASEEGYDDVRLVLGIALIAGYGVAIGMVGMAWATMAFIAGWLVLGRLRRPLTVLLVSTIGTAAILYLFVKVSLMPLDRGKGLFEQATIALYRVLGIY